MSPKHSHEPSPQPRPDVVLVGKWKGSPQTPGYDPATFYGAASDGKGHSETKYIKVPPDVWAWVMRVVGDAKWPQYTNPHEFIRDAMVHRLFQLAELYQDKDTLEMAQKFALSARFQHMANLHKLDEQHILNASTAMNVVLNSGSRKQQIYTLRNVETLIGVRELEGLPAIQSEEFNGRLYRLRQEIGEILPSEEPIED